MNETSPPSETPTPAVSPPENPTPRGRPRVPAAAWLGAMLVLALALTGSSPYWAPALMPLLPWGVQRPALQLQAQQRQAQEQTAARLATIEQQLGQLRTIGDRVTALEKRPLPDASAAVAPLAGQVRQLSAQLDRVDARLAQLARDQATSADSSERMLMIALASLGNAVAGSRPFAAELASVEALGHNRAGWAAALQPLEAPAKTGIPSTAVLAQRFSNKVAPAILRAEVAVPTAHESLGEAMLAKLRSLVVVRRVDRKGVGKSPTDRAVAEAQAALDHGDLAGAVEALAALQGAPASAARPWLAVARQRLSAERTIAKLDRRLAADIAAGTSGD